MLCNINSNQDICTPNVCVANSSQSTTLKVVLAVAFRDVTADLLNEVCHNVSTEPELQPLLGELLSHRTANTEDGDRLDVKAQGFWGDRRQCASYDVQVFNPLASSNRCLPLPQCFQSHEKEKRRAYDQ